MTGRSFQPSRPVAPSDRVPVRSSEDMIVLDEFRLRDADIDGGAARIVAAALMGSRDPPMLTSIDDPHDVAVLHTVAAGSPGPPDLRENITLGHLVAAWRCPKRYRSRIAAATDATHPTTFWLAVTESGISDEPTSPDTEWLGPATSGELVAMLLVGVPVGTHAGSLVLVGRAGSALHEGGSSGWPLPLSRALGVRVYRG